MRTKILKPVHWFDQKFSTKDSMQALVVMAFVLLIVATKCYMMFT